MTQQHPDRFRPLTLPPLRDPARYVGLYVYDFGTHVAVGYTAAELQMLRSSEAHGGGQAYEIYRAGEGGTIELRAVLDQRLGAIEAICFLRRDGAAARRDYDALLAAAGQSRVPCAVTMSLAKLYDFDPPNVTALSYPAGASTAMSGWLTAHAPHAGDSVIGGIDAHGALAGSDGVHITSCQLPSVISVADRSVDEVLRTVDEPLQR